MVVAVPLMRMVKMAIHEVVDMVAMRDRLMTAARSMDVRSIVPAASMPSRTLIRIARGFFDGVLLDRPRRSLMVQVPIVQVVDVVAMFDCRVSAGLAVNMIAMLTGFGHF